MTLVGSCILNHEAHKNIFFAVFTVFAVQLLIVTSSIPFRVSHDGFQRETGNEKVTNTIHIPMYGAGRSQVFWTCLFTLGMWYIDAFILPFILRFVHE